jgi:hypothetical protein
MQLDQPVANRSIDQKITHELHTTMLQKKTGARRRPFEVVL